MMKKATRLAALFLSLCMVFSLAACGGSGDNQPSASPSPSSSGGSGSGSNSGNGGSGSGGGSSSTGEGVVAPIKPDASGVAAKWSEKKTADGWMLVDNGDGESLGYSPNSGIKLIQVDGYAFKDLDGDGELDGYEDWRNSDDVRARDLAAQMAIEDMIPLYAHDGWMSFGPTVDESSNDYDYLTKGGRAGVTRSAINEGSTTMAVDWTNALQAWCEGNGGWGIPATISVDPSHIAKTIDQNSLGATMSVDEAFNLGVTHGKMYRSVGVTMLLGPQISVASEPTMTRATGAWTEDPALGRDLTDAYISGLQSTWSDDGKDLGWGKDSVYAIAKHYVGDGAPEGGRNDHSETGKYDVFPGSNFEASLIPFIDAAFNLKGSVTKEAGVMPNYSIAYSRDGSLGELVGGAYSSYKMDLLREMGYNGFVLSDWDITRDLDNNGKPFGVEDLTVAERFAKLMKNGVHQVGNTQNLDAIFEAYDLLVDELGQAEADAIVRNFAYHFFLTQMYCQLYDNPYIDLDNAQKTVYTAQTDKAAKEQQQKSVIMLKNSGNTIAKADGSKKTVYIPAVFESGSSGGGSGDSGGSGGGSSDPKWSYVFDLDVARRYFNVITDTVLDPTGTDADGKSVYTENDIKRVSAADLAKCDMILYAIDAPSQDSTKKDDGTYLPPNLQFESYTATTARRESIAGNVTKEIINDGYGSKEQTVKENRSYANQTTGRASNYSDYEELQRLNSIKGSAKLVLLVSKGSGPSVMVFSEIEPLCDAILFYYGSTSWFFEDGLMEIVAGQVEPSGLLPFQMPASMEAVEAQQEDVPRDMECYKDADGNVYDFTFGLNWSGKINDERVKTYSADPISKLQNINFHYAN